MTYNDKIINTIERTPSDYLVEIKCVMNSVKYLL